MAPPAKRTRKPAAPEPVEVRLPITLGQFLKAARLVSSGGEAKILIADGQVVVNGQTETRRGRKLMSGDIVQVHGLSARVTTGTASEGTVLPAGAEATAAADSDPAPPAS